MHLMSVSVEVHVHSWTIFCAFDRFTHALRTPTHTDTQTETFGVLLGGRLLMDEGSLRAGKMDCTGELCSEDFRLSEEGSTTEVVYC